MSHNIDETVTGGAFAAVRQPAWHGLGVTIDQPVKALELLRLANADFPILRGAVRLDETVPLDDSGAFTVRYEAVDSRNTLIYRIHPETGEAQILGVASKGYPLLTPAQTLIGFGDAIMGPGHMRSATAGVLDEGRQVFMSFELPEDLCLGGGDPARLKAEAEELLAVKVTNAKFLEIISDLWAPEENAGKAKVTRWESHRDHLRHLFEAAPTQEFGRGTGWAAVNAVTEDRDWFSQVKGADSDEQRDATRFSRSIGLTKSTGITEPKLAIAQRVLALV
jgi:hypothetical protein